MRRWCRVLTLTLCIWIILINLCLLIFTREWLILMPWSRTSQDLSDISYIKIRNIKSSRLRSIRCIIRNLFVLSSIQMEIVVYLIKFNSKYICWEQWVNFRSRWCLCRVILNINWKLRRYIILLIILLLTALYPKLINVLKTRWWFCLVH